MIHICPVVKPLHPLAAKNEILKFKVFMNNIQSVNNKIIYQKMWAINEALSSGLKVALRQEKLYLACKF